MIYKPKRKFINTSRIFNITLIALFHIKKNLILFFYAIGDSK